MRVNDRFEPSGGGEGSGGEALRFSPVMVLECSRNTPVDIANSGVVLVHVVVGDGCQDVLLELPSITDNESYGLWTGKDDRGNGGLAGCNGQRFALVHFVPHAMDKF